MKTPIQISVIIPSYNSARFLETSVGSVLRQSYPAAEIIVVDDGSSDDTPEVAARYGPSVRYIRRPNGGLSAARNTGLKNASHPWVAFLDADDWWDSRKLELQVGALQGCPEALLCYTARLLVYSDGSQEIREACPTADVWRNLRHENSITPSTVLMRRDLCLKAGGFDEKLAACEDWDLWFRLGPDCRMVAVEAPVTTYRVSTTSMSGDIDRMLTGVRVMLDRTLLRDLTGFRRWFWKRRIWSSQLFRCAIVAREAKHPERSLSLLIRSFAAWPSPLFLAQRWSFLAVHFRRRVSQLAEPTR
jgi:teichuronic acid biosynthesis glycosyltransferase TuaG